MGKSMESGNRFVWFRSCVRSCARSGCLVESDRKSWDGPFPFFLMPLRAFPFTFPPPPNLISNLVRFIGVFVDNPEVIADYPSKIWKALRAFFTIASSSLCTHQCVPGFWNERQQKLRNPEHNKDSHQTMIANRLINYLSSSSASSSSSVSIPNMKNTWWAQPWISVVCG